MERKTSEAQIKANRKWEEKNKSKVKYINSKSRAKNFILKLSELEDLDIFEEYIKERRKELK